MASDPRLPTPTLKCLSTALDSLLVGLLVLDTDGVIREHNLATWGLQSTGISCTPSGVSWLWRVNRAGAACSPGGFAPSPARPATGIPIGAAPEDAPYLPQNGPE